MNPLNVRRLQLGCAFVGALLTMPACGSVITFSDEVAIPIMGTPPPPPPPPPPPEKPKRVELRDNKIVIAEKIQFAYNDSKILEVSHGLLDEIGKVIKESPHVKKIAIEGHASSDGADKHNLMLSDGRAQAVRLYLVEKVGIPADKLSAKGFGEERLLVQEEGLEGGTLEAAREKNRRVEFNVVAQDVTESKVEVDPNTGQERTLETKTLGAKKAASQSDKKEETK